MAEIAYTIVGKTDQGRAGKGFVVAWDNVTEADTFQMVKLPADSDISVHFGGTFGGATVLLKGSNFVDGAEMVGLNDIFGTAISATAAELNQVGENTHFVQPTHSGGTGSTVDVRIQVYIK